jgi:hypothetical protein
MSNLTDDNIDFIAQRINSSMIKSAEMKEDLIDHFCCAIEEDMNKGLCFEESYHNAFKNICPDGFDEIQHETVFLLTFNKIKGMKRFLYLSAYLTAISMTITLYFSLTGKPGGNIALLVSSLLLIFLLLPALFLNQYKRELSKNITTKIAFIFGFSGVTLFLVSVVFKISHWPGAKVMLLLSLVIVNLAYFPFLFFKMYKKSLT